MGLHRWRLRRPPRRQNSGPRSQGSSSLQGGRAESGIFIDRLGQDRKHSRVALRHLGSLRCGLPEARACLGVKHQEQNSDEAEGERARHFLSEKLAKIYSYEHLSAMDPVNLDTALTLGLRV